jgi:branched-chain amino acid transport system permease protein
VLRAIKSNEKRLATIAIPIFQYKLVAFVIAGAICGIAGALSAIETQFASPAIMHWTRSGELLIIVIVGGMGAMLGPVLGTAVYLTLEYVLAGITDAWQGILGTLLILLVFYAKGGILGLFGRAPAAWKSSASFRNLSPETERS